MATKEQTGTVSSIKGGITEKTDESSDKQAPGLHPGAALEARPNTSSLMVKRAMKGKSMPLYFWTAPDVNKWLRKHGGLYYEMYGDLLLNHQVTGRTLIRMNDIKLEKIGILDASHRNDLLQFFLRLRLKHEMADLRKLNQRGSGFELKLPDSRSQGTTTSSPLSKPASPGKS